LTFSFAIVGVFHTAAVSCGARGVDLTAARISSTVRVTHSVFQPSNASGSLFASLPVAARNIASVRGSRG
jgi:hypothetical protein